MKFTKIGFIILIFFIITGFLFAKKTLVPFSKDHINAELVWERIKKDENYQKYAYWPDRKGMQPGKSSHAPFYKAYINSVVKNSLPIQNKLIPYSGMIVKEDYDPDKEIININVMVKVKGYNPQDNDWYWVQYNSEGRVITAGKAETCINCHKAYYDNDYLITHKLNK